MDTNTLKGFKVYLGPDCDPEELLEMMDFLGVTKAIPFEEEIPNPTNGKHKEKIKNLMKVLNEDRDKTNPVSQ